MIIHFYSLDANRQGNGPEQAGNGYHSQHKLPELAMNFNFDNVERPQEEMVGPSSPTPIMSQTALFGRTERRCSVSQ
jgi:hypothetical protein